MVMQGEFFSFLRQVTLICTSKFQSNENLVLAFHLNLKNTYFLAESKEQDSCFDYSAVHVVRLVIMMIELIELI